MSAQLPLLEQFYEAAGTRDRSEILAFIRLGRAVDAVRTTIIIEEIYERAGVYRGGLSNGA
jgi:hypothetical protein